MEYGINLIAAIPLRLHSSEKSEMISQLLFGETYDVLDDTPGWVFIQHHYDNYKGWISLKQHHPLPVQEYNRLKNLTGTVLYQPFVRVTRGDLASFIITAGSDLPGYDPSNGNITIDGLEFHLDKDLIKSNKTTKKDLLITAGEYLFSPYLWGGRSFFGCDCSGFVQIVHKIHHRFLPRDASQQAKCGTAIASLDHAEPGDLAFFLNKDQRVHHVGLIISPNEIIHCSGFVRIDPLDEKGIYLRKDHSYTHTGMFIRRIV